jgi:hypothetical protein
MYRFHQRFSLLSSRSLPIDGQTDDDDSGYRRALLAPEDEQARANVDYGVRILEWK